MRIRGFSVSLGVIVALTLAGCGGGAPTSEETRPTATTAPATPPTTAAGAAADDDEDLGAPLLAWADSDTDEGKAPLTIKFKADVEGGVPPLTYVWKFGDGSPDSTEANPTHTYQKPGKYRADLEEKDSAGDSDSDYLEIEVQ
jgi:PKD repeat protein